MEQYKKIIEFPSYEISDYGNIRNSKGKVLSAVKDKKGYRMVCLRKAGKSYTKRISKMVGIYFVPNPLNKTQVNHINGIRDDDRAVNIEWNTGSENITHAYQILNRKGSQTGKIGSLSPFAKKVIETLPDGSEKIWGSMKELAAHYSVSKTTIKDYIAGNRIKECKLKLRFYE